MLDQLAWLVPARWGFSMVAATTGLADVARGTVDPAWEHRVSVWIGDLTLLAVTAVVTLGLVVLLLRRLDPRRGRH